jgi:hypothetical protein
VADVFVERSFDPPLAEDELGMLASGAGACLGFHRVEWCESFLSSDRRRLFCRFDAPDAESVRIVFRQAEAQVSAVWAGSVHPASGGVAEDLPRKPARPNVLGQRICEAPIDLTDFRRSAVAASWCLAMYRVILVRSFLSRDRKRAIHLYHATDAESVRLAERSSGMPLDKVWPCRGVGGCLPVARRLLGGRAPRRPLR